LDTSVLFVLTNFTERLTGPYYSRVYKSVDGGMNWKQILDSAKQRELFYTLIMFDESEWIVSSFNKYLLRTTDGGNTWNHEPLSVNPFYAKKYGDSTVIYTSGDSTCISENRGKTWRCSELKIIFHKLRPSKQYFINKDTVFVLTLSNNYFYELFYTFNSGNIWQQKALDSNLSYSDIYFFNTNEGYLLSGNSILKTTDLGNTFTEFKTNLPAFFLSAIEFINDSIALIAGSNGVLFKWNKNQTVWTSVHKKVPIKFNVAITPNPTNNLQTLQFAPENPVYTDVKLYDVSGRCVQDVFSGIYEQESSIKADLSSLVSGVYFYKVSIGESSFFYKTVKF
jgi:photosystem II stability/assembly factor-like uncharacterized protein